MLKKIIYDLINAVLAGIMIGVGGTVYILCENKYIGAILFGFGLFIIICFKFGLYTGKVGYIPLKKSSYIIEVIISFIGNSVGVSITALLVMMTRFGKDITAKALIISECKLNDTLISSFILAVLCGMLMYLAVESNKIFDEKQNHLGSIIGIFLPIIVFIMCGFNHSIADIFYLVVSKTRTNFVLYVCIVMLGNAVGAMFIPFIKKYVLEKIE